MDVSPTPRSDSGFHLSNLQVIVILLVCGALLIGATWVVAREFGHVPVSLWDICTSVVSGSDSGTSAAGATSAVVVPKP